MQKKLLIMLLVTIIYHFISCKKEAILIADPGEHLVGGATTFFNTSGNSFGFAAPNLNSLQSLQFNTGNSFFRQAWVSAVASTTSRDGLGPLFNETACSNCHFKDGRGRAPQFGEPFGHGLLMRLSRPGTNPFGGPLGDPVYGDQLSHGALLTINAEGNFDISYTEQGGLYGDGSSYSLRNPVYTLKDLNYGPVASDLMLSPRVANQIVGMGLIDAIRPQDILENTDEFDQDNDGISGKANYVYDVASNSMKIGKFGWKCGQPNVRQQVASAFVGDIGITSSLYRDENYTDMQPECTTVVNGNNSNGYELDDMVLDRVELYTSTLAVPGRRNWRDQNILKGKALFFEAGCQKCHIQNFTTGNHSKFEALNNQSIYPYSDFLLHDMGEQLADNRPEYLANGQEWRTPPLWGIGLIEVVNGHTELLHDGRARNIEEAILWHGGEAKNAQENFKKMSSINRKDLIDFIKSL